MIRNLIGYNSHKRIAKLHISIQFSAIDNERHHQKADALASYSNIKQFISYSISTFVG